MKIETYNGNYCNSEKEYLHVEEIICFINFDLAGLIANQCIIDLKIKIYCYSFLRINIIDLMNVSYC